MTSQNQLSRRDLLKRIQELERTVERQRTEIAEYRQSPNDAAARLQQIRMMAVETNHRVKNNLQALGALLELYSDEHTSTVPAEDVRKLSRHVRGLAALHDLLTTTACTGDNDGLISVRNLLEQLLDPLETATGGHKIVANLEDALVSPRQASALAILANELVSNAVKHGSGEVEISFRTSGDRAEFAVCEDGRGFPPEFDMSRHGNVGMDLVTTVSQWDLQGRVLFENLTGGGSRVKVRFPLESGREGCKGSACA